jgi:glutathione synthase/RimK-type ligase-like ATP-grasp enzyme
LDTIPKQYKWIINWGNPTSLSYSSAQRVINIPTQLQQSINKLLSFRRWKEKGVPIPEFSTELLDNRKGVWLARTNVTGSGGDGIVVIREDDGIPKAPLYVKYIRKTQEFRAHVVNGKVIFVQQKKRKSDAEQTKDQKLIRNYDNGWVFCPLEKWDKELEDVAIAAVAGLGLDFGAVDMVLGMDTGKYYCLELNSAPGLESPTLIEAYKEAFSTWLV